VSGKDKDPTAWGKTHSHVAAFFGAFVLEKDESDILQMVESE
jgi:hypothetical protein